jgi:ATP dependent DNA ligase domain
MNPAYRPMLATLVDEPFDDKRLVFETKWDGFRLITEKRSRKVTLWSRNGIDVTTTCACGLGRACAARGFYRRQTQARSDLQARRPLTSRSQIVSAISVL